ncbi:alpha/beta fold hydrolase [Sulfitobacter pontiacus]|uniref:alpha/beta fold hydrolase n=1 Tax=Sulfitobacter pontiacus TaxID=60137 RepID=UPI0030EC529A
MLLILTLVALGLVIVVHWRASAREAAANAAYPPIGELIDIDGVKVHAKVQGSGPDLVLIHGASGNMRDFTFDMVDQLSDRYRVILFDRPGLGWTDNLPQHAGAWNATAATPHEQAALLQKAADQLGVSNPIVLGHSYGGAVALAWGLSRPDDTAALVLVSAVSEPWEGDLGWQYKITGSAFGSGIVIPLVTAFVPQGFVRASVDAIFAPQATPDGYSDHIGTGLSLRRMSMRANAQQVNTLLPEIKKMVPKYDTLTMPVELIHGTADTIVPLDVHAAIATPQLPDAVLTTLPGIGHMPQHVTQPDVIAVIDRAATRAGLR